MRVYFGLGAAVVYLGLFGLGWEVCVDPWFVKRSWKLQIASIGAILLFLDLFTIGVVLVKAPLELRALVIDGEYQPGTTIGGIVWGKQLADLRVWVKDSSDSDYESVDLLIRPDQFVFKSALLNGPVGCELLLDDATEVHDAVTDPKTGKKYTNTIERMATNAGYRLRCAKLPSRFTIKTVFAAVDVSDFIPKEATLGDMPYSLFGPRPPLHTVAITGHYQCGLKTYTVSQYVPVGKGN